MLPQLAQDTVKGLYTSQSWTSENNTLSLSPMAQASSPKEGSRKLVRKVVNDYSKKTKTKKYFCVHELIAALIACI